jgi:hypothetical protein
VSNLESNEVLKKLVKLTGERAKLDAKANDSYVVYKDTTGKLVKEHYNGTKEFVPFEKPAHV